MWKAQNIEDYPIQNEVQIPKIDNRTTRATSRGDVVIHGKSDICKSAFINDAGKIRAGTVDRIRRTE